jgi:hypothetical protein
MTSQALSGVIALRLVSREGSPSLLEVRHTHTHAPPCFWHRTRGFLKVRRLWEPGSSLTTGDFSLFHLLPKVSAVNVHWTEHNSYLSFSQKSSN